MIDSAGIGFGNAVTDMDERLEKRKGTRSEQWDINVRMRGRRR
jgi:hypothetical protein